MIEKAGKWASNERDQQRAGTIIPTNLEASFASH